MFKNSFHLSQKFGMIKCGGFNMKTVYDVQQMLKKFGTYIYTGDRIGDLKLMSLEVSELFESGFIEKSEYQLAILILKREINKVNEALH